MFALFILTAASLSGQQNQDFDLNKKVSITLRGQSISKALKEIQKAVGFDLDASSIYNNWPVIIQVKNRPLSEVLNPIASSTHSHWVKQKTGYRLEIDQESVSAMNNRLFDARKKALQDSLDKYIQDHKKDESWDRERIQVLVDEEKKQINSMLEGLRQGNPDIDTQNVHVRKGSTRASTPATPAFLEILQALPIDTLAAVKRGQRLVFSSQPTLKQRALPLASLKVINKFVDAHNLLASLAKGGSQLPANVTVSGGLDLNAKPLNASNIVVLVTVQRGSSENGVGISIKFADGDGTYVGNAMCSLDASTASESAPELNIPANQESVSLSTVSSELAKAFITDPSSDSQNRHVVALSDGGASFRVSSDGPEPCIPLSNEALGILKDPVNFDPTSTFVSDSLLDVAKKADIDVVAVIPDRSIVPMARLATSAGQVKKFINGLSTANLKVKFENQLLAIEPQESDLVDRAQMDRKAASQFFGTLMKYGYSRLYDRAQFCLALGSPIAINNFAMKSLDVLCPSESTNLRTDIGSNGHYLQWLAMLDRSSLESTKDDIQFSMSAMTPGQRKVLEDSLYSSALEPLIIGEGDFMAVSIGDGPADGIKPPSVRDEPTVMFPNGLPLSTVVGIKFELATDLLFARAGLNRGGDFVTPSSLGMQQAFRADNSNAELASKLQDYNQFQFASGKKVSFQVSFDPKILRSSEFLDAWISQGSAKMNQDELPQDMKEKIKSTKESMKIGHFSFGNAGQKPPLSN